jgi:peptide/nickel transport system substrate-binding protein
MRRRLVAQLGAAAVLGSLLAATSAHATAAEPPATTLTVAIPGPFGGCDPASPTTTPSTDAVLSLVLPSAFTEGPLAVPVGDTSVIAQAEVVNLSPQTVVYTIAPGVRWPSGAAFSPADLVRTWEQRRADRVVGDLGYREIASVTPTAMGTGVTVVFTTPYSDWESLFNLVVPAGTHGARCALPTAALDPSIGPYELVSASHREISLVVNPAWTGAPPAYTAVHLTTDPGTPSAPSAPPRTVFLAAPSTAQLQAVTSTGAYTSHLEHSTTVVSLDFAVRGAGALSPMVRGAVARFVDRGAILDGLATPIDYTTTAGVSHLLGQGQQGYLGLPGTPVVDDAPPTTVIPGASGADAYGEGPNIAQADAMLVAAGYAKSRSGWLTPGRSRFSMCMAVPDAPAALHAAAAIVAAQLERQGIVVTLRATPTSLAAVATLRGGSCTTALVSRTGDGFITHSGANWLAPAAPIATDLSWTGVDDPVVTTNALAAAGMLNPIEAQPSWNAMDARLWDLMAGLPLYSPSIYEAWSPSIAGVLPTDTVSGFVDQVPTLLPASTKP